MSTKIPPIYFEPFLRGNSVNIRSHFDNYRFVMPTKIKAEKLNPKKPGDEIKDFIQVAEQASIDLRKEGLPLSALRHALRPRIELMINRYQYKDGELSIWTGKKPRLWEGVKLSYQVGIIDGLEKALQEELIKKDPDLETVVSKFMAGGANEIFGFWERVAQGKITSIKREGKKLKKATMVNKMISLRLVKQFRPTLTFAQINRQFYDEFREWLETPQTLDPEQPRKAVVYDPNNISKIIGQFKSVLNIAREYKIKVDDGYNDWPVSNKPNKVFVLSKEELLSLMKMEVKQQNFLDVFIMACFIGPRVSDYDQMVDRDNYHVENGLYWFKASYSKVEGTYVEIPLPPEFWKHFSKRWPTWKRGDESYFNRSLKRILKEAGMNRLVPDKVHQIVMVDGEEVHEFVEKKVPLYRAIQSHTARRTAASGWFYGVWGNPLSEGDCMTLTGHKSVDSFRRYIGADPKDTKRRIEARLGYEPYMQVG